MGGTMGRLYIGTTGLQASQYAINTTAHNLTNLNTDGYSRQQILMTDMYYNRLSVNAVGYNLSGTGSKISSTRQVRDLFLDRAYRTENGRRNYYLAQYEAIAEVEDYFGEMEGSSFQTCMENIWNSVQELQKNSTNLVNRNALIAYADTFIDRANGIYEKLVNYQKNLNQEIQDQIDQINLLAQQIYDANEKIRKYEASGLEEANDYRDARNKALDELSGYINIRIEENTDGTVDVFAEGRSLVTADRTFKLSTAVIDGTDFLKPVWEQGQEDVFQLERLPSTDAGTDIGSLKGLIMSRGDKTPSYLDIPVDGTQDEIDTYLNEVEPYAIANIIAQFDQLIHGMVTAINDVLCPNKELTLADGTVIQVLDEEKAGYGMGEVNHIQGTELFTRNQVSRYTEEAVTILNDDGTTSTITVMRYNEEDASDKSTLYTLGNIGINKELVKNASLLPLTAQDGGETQDIAEELLAKWNEPFATLGPDSKIPNTFSEYYAAFIDDFANKGYTYNGIASSLETTLTETDNSRQQIVGVSSDEELSNLIRFQQAYNANCRYITVVAEMLEHLVTKLGS